MRPSWAWAAGAAFCILQGAAFAQQPASAFGAMHALMVDGSGAIWGAGDNAFGQLAGQSASRQAAVLLPGREFVAVAAGDGHSLALDREGAVWSWGKNDAGQLCDGGARQRADPKRVAGLPKIKAIAAGGNFSLALDEAGAVWGCGANQIAQLGVRAPQRAFAYSPLMGRVPLPEPVAALAAAGTQVLALGKSGRILHWGAGRAPAPVRARAGRGVALAGAAAVGGYLSDLWLQSREGKLYRLQSCAGAARAPSCEFRAWQFPKPPAHALALTAVAARVAAGSSPGTAPPRVAAKAADTVSNTPPRTLPSTTAPVVLSPPVAPVQSPRAPVPLQAIPASVPVVPALAAVPPGAAIAGAESAAAKPVAVPPPNPSPQQIAVVAPREAQPARMVELSGRVSSPGGSGIEGVDISVQGGSCGATDANGAFNCKLPEGWSGRVSAARRNFRFSPSSVTVSDLAADGQALRFTGLFDPR